MTPVTIRTTCLSTVMFTCLTTAAQAQHTAAASFAALRATLKTGDTRTTIYQERQQAAAVDIVPLLGPSRVGAWMSIRF